MNKLKLLTVSSFALALSVNAFAQTKIQVQNGLELQKIRSAKTPVIVTENSTIPAIVKSIDANGAILKDFGFNPNVPVQKQVWGYMYNAVNQMCIGDSAVIIALADSLYGPSLSQSGMKPGDKVYFSVKILTPEEVELNNKKEFENQKGIVIKNESELKEYFAKNNIKPLRSPDGIYYTITSEGTGAIPGNGQTVVANYTGKLLDGSVFDSNMLPEFNHVQPFEFQVGKGMVIQGWDKGFGMFKKGTKATIYLTSNLAYGTRGSGPKIKPNECLIFDIELVDIK